MPVLVLLQVCVCQLANPVDHILVLHQPALVLPVHLGVAAIVLEEARVILGVMGQLCIAEEVQHFLAVVLDPRKLRLSVLVNIAIVLCGRIL